MHDELGTRAEERTANLIEANRRLHKEIIERARVEEALRKRNHEWALLNRSTQAFNSTLDVEQVLAAVLEEVRRLLGVVACSVWLLDPESDELVCQEATGLRGEIVRGWRLASGEGIAGWVAHSGESLIVSDTRTDRRHFKDIDRQTGLKLRSILAVPLQVKQRMIGVLQVLDDKPGRFAAADLALLEPLAASAAIAIENARLYEETESLRAFNENIVQSMNEGITLEDESGQITFFNRKAAKLLGYLPKELIGQRWAAIVSPEHRAQVERETARQHQGLASQYETAILTRDGQRVHVLVSARSLSEDGRHAGTLTVFMDITERKRTEQMLRTSEQMFRDLFENVPLCVFEVDLEQTSPTIMRANRRAQTVYGWSSEEIASLPLTNILPLETIPGLGRIVDVLRAGETVTLEALSQRRDASTFPARIIVSAETESSLSRAIITVEDITIEKSRRSEEEAIAEERRRIAREIHDGLAQDLAFLRLRARLWHNLVDRDPAQMHAELDELREFLSGKIREVRRSIFALRPVALDELGFYPALRQFASDFGEQNQLQVNLRILGMETRLPPSLEPVLFRIIQEALHNVGKHAHAHTASIELDLEDAALMTLVVRDDGVGFDPAILDQAAQCGHLGLTQMRERVEALGGTLLLQSRAGEGARVRVTLPLSGEL